MIIQAHLGIIMAQEVMLDWMGKKGVGKICRFFLSNFSAKNLLINSLQAHQIAAHPFHHLPMGLPDDNPSSFVDHYGSPGGHAGLDGSARCWQDFVLLPVQLFSQKPPDQQPSSTSDCCSSFSSSPNGSTT
jgi:hypothetical protein